MAAPRQPRLTAAEERGQVKVVRGATAFRARAAPCLLAAARRLLRRRPPLQGAPPLAAALLPLVPPPPLLPWRLLRRGRRRRGLRGPGPGSVLARAPATARVCGRATAGAAAAATSGGAPASRQQLGNAFGLFSRRRRLRCARPLCRRALPFRAAAAGGLIAGAARRRGRAPAAAARRGGWLGAARARCSRCCGPYHAVANDGTAGTAAAPCEWPPLRWTAQHPAIAAARAARQHRAHVSLPARRRRDLGTARRVCYSYAASHILPMNCIRCSRPKDCLHRSREADVLI